MEYILKVIDADKAEVNANVVTNYTKDAVSTLLKGRSTSDELATTVTRAARLVAASLGYKMASEWLPKKIRQMVNNCR